MRWAKLLSSNEGTCTAAGIVADNSGNIYVAGSLQCNLYIGYDTIIQLANDGSGLIQFDTAGISNGYSMSVIILHRHITLPRHLF